MRRAESRAGTALANLRVRLVGVGLFVAACAAAGAVPATATLTETPDRSPTLKRLLVFLMTHPTEKHDADPNRIDFVLRTGDFKTPAQTGRPVDEKDPKTFVVERASVALVDRPPFALTPDQIGTEDTLIVQVFLSSTGHMQWHTEDQGAKGPRPGGTEDQIPFFGRDPRALYREYLNLILTSLQGPSTKKR